ncbi:MAG: lamin tail domain-containing protein [Polyangiaceae bacterium]|nr:lamin tail domain-containing protein [Polyangiaceae bacterium]
MARSIHRLGLLVSLATFVAACDGDGTTGTGGSGGSGASGGGTTSSSTSSSTSTSTSGTMGGSGGTGGTTGGTGGTTGGTGGTTGGSGGMTTTTGGAGGMTTSSTTSGTGGTGGMVMPTEICGNGMDDDADMKADCEDSDCVTAPACGVLKINEVDYDNPMTDTAEFVEILNAGTTDVDLSTLTLEIVNGNGGVVLHSVPLAGVLAAGGYLLVATPGVMGIAPGTMVIPMPMADSNMQNGGVPEGDGVALYDTVNKTVIDALSYEGSVTAAMINGGMFNLVSGMATTAYDDGYPGKSLIRFPNGQDTNEDANDWTGTWTITPGAANVASEVCDDLLDNDKDGAADCADPNCNDTPECPEDCLNGMDDDGDMLVDCADPFCDTKACNMFGSVCAGMMCTCPGGTVETTCTGGMDDDCDGMIDCSDPDCSMSVSCLMLTVNSVDYQVITHGGKLVLTGAGFTGATSVTIGGISVMFAVDSNNQITIAQMPDNVPLGTQPIVVTAGAAMSMPFNVTVIHMLINELDADTPATDAAEFVEISTGVPNVSLAGYTLVFWNGSNDTSYLALNLNGSTDANGMLLVGNSGVMPVPPVTWANNTLQNGQDAVAIYQAPLASFPNGAMVTGTAVIDALVYDTNDADDPGLLDALIGPMGTLGRVQVDEGASPTSEAQSIQRCGDGRLRGDKFAVGAPTPAMANNVAACP